jgi:hypothetical protein
MFSYQNLRNKVIIDLSENNRNIAMSGNCNPFSNFVEMSCPYPPRGLAPRSTLSLRL